MINFIVSYLVSVYDQTLDFMGRLCLKLSILDFCRAKITKFASKGISWCDFHKIKYEHILKYAV